MDAANLLWRSDLNPQIVCMPVKWYQTWATPAIDRRWDHLSWQNWSSIAASYRKSACPLRLPIRADRPHRRSLGRSSQRCTRVPMRGLLPTLLSRPEPGRTHTRRSDYPLRRATPAEPPPSTETTCRWPTGRRVCHSPGRSRRYRAPALVLQSNRTFVRWHFSDQ